MRSWDFPKTNLEAVALFKCSNTHLVEMLASFATPFDEYGKKVTQVTRQTVSSSKFMS